MHALSYADASNRNLVLYFKW